MCLARKHYSTLKLVFGIKLISKLWFSSPQTLRLHVKLLTGLVAYCNTCKAMQATNAWAKVNTETKVLQIKLVAIIFHNSTGSSYRTLKDLVLWN